MSFLRSAFAATLGAFVTCFMVGPTLAHEFWIQPSSFHPLPGGPVMFHLKVGEAFIGEPVPRLPGVIAAFDLTTASGTVAVPGEFYADPAGFLLWSDAGAAIASYVGNPYPMELPADAFERYLVAEGLDHVVALRRERGQSAASGRERFSRYAKTLLTGEGSAALFTRPLNQRLEIVPERDPSTLRVGAALPVRVFHQGEPLPGVLVCAWGGLGAPRIAKRTDAGGRAEIELSAPGPWLVSAVHMVDASAGTDAEWESLWASLTFDIDGVRAPEVAGQAATSSPTETGPSTLVAR